MYARAVEAVGGVPVLLPLVGTADAAVGVVARLDGLVISGGADVDPGRYGEPPHELTANWRTDRDTWELALLDAAETAGLPTLGVCRGMQVMAVGAGGRLEQHVPDRVAHEGHRPGGDVFGPTLVDIRPGSRLAGLVGERLSVHCHHHQSVLEHPGFAPVAHAPDGILEAIELDGGRFCVGVQWHPERVRDAGLFAGLVTAAAGFRDEHADSDTIV